MASFSTWAIIPGSSVGPDPLQPFFQGIGDGEAAVLAEQLKTADYQRIFDHRGLGKKFAGQPRVGRIDSDLTPVFGGNLLGQPRKGTSRKYGFGGFQDSPWRGWPTDRRDDAGWRPVVASMQLLPWR